MTYIVSTPRLGMVDISDVTTRVPGISGLPSVSLEPFLGEIATGYDNATTIASGGEFIYLRVPASTTIAAGSLVIWTHATSGGGPYTAAVLPVLATSKNTGAALAVSVNAIASNTSVQYAWFQIQGRATALKTAVTVSPDVVIYASATAGRFKVLTSAGGQITNARTANIATVTSTTSTVILYLSRPSVQGQVT